MIDTSRTQTNGDLSAVDAKDLAAGQQKAIGELENEAAIFSKPDVNAGAEKMAADVEEILETGGRGVQRR